jgi:uncharacterized protein YegP (UPF0339 family)
MRFVVYRDEKREWRWRLISANHCIIADSGEGYRRRAGALKGIKAVCSADDSTKIEIVEEK